MILSLPGMNSRFRCPMVMCARSWDDETLGCTFHDINGPCFPGPSADVSVRIGAVQSGESFVTNFSTLLQMTTQDCDPSFPKESILTSTPHRFQSFVTKKFRAGSILVLFPIIPFLYLLKSSRGCVFQRHEFVMRCCSSSLIADLVTKNFPLTTVLVKPASSHTLGSAFLLLEDFKFFITFMHQVSSG